MKKRGMHGFWCKHMKADKSNCHHHCGGCGGIYFLGFIGSAVFYLQQSATFWQGVVGILKAFVWPAFLVYKLLG
jgi:hypothetical protein